MIIKQIPHLNDCASPIRIRNKYTHEVLTVPCGHCAACRASKIVRPVTPIMRESSFHRYTVFFTLTYNDSFLPRCDLKKFVPHPDYEEVYKTLYEQSIDYIQFVSYCLPFAPTSDVQKFCKRLRKNFACFNEQLRYYISSDYGSTTFRPHWHGLLFFSNKELAYSIESLICKSWSINGSPIGAVDVQFARGAAAYVACYIHQVIDLPVIYRYREFRPKSVHSSSPPLGSGFPRIESDEEIVRNGLAEVTMYDLNKSVYHKTALLPSDVRRLFPTIPGFLRLHKYERLEIYRIFSRFIGCEVDLRRRALESIMNVNSFIRDYVFYGRMYYDMDFLHSRLDNIFYCVRRLVLVCSSFQLSFSDYDDCIDNYYRNRWLSSYRKHVEFFNLTGLEYDVVFSDSKQKPYEYELDYFDSKEKLLNSLVKRKLNNAYLEIHPEFKQFHK